MKILFRIEAVNPERLPSEGPVLLCANHVRLFDIPLIHLQTDRWIYWVARESLFRFFISSHFFPWWGASPIDVKSATPSQVKMIMKRLQEGKCIGIFPQGTRCHTQEKLERTVPKSGTLAFAMKTGAYVQPCAIEGGFKLFRKTRVIFGEPFKITKEYLEENNTDLVTETIRLMDTIFGLMGKTYPLKNKSKLTSGRIPDVE